MERLQAVFKLCYWLEYVEYGSKAFEGGFLIS